MKIKKGSWVQIHKTILRPEERSPLVPEDTKKVPLEMWVKGFLEEDAELGEEVTIKTLTKRIERGTLVMVNPHYSHSFGEFVPEIVIVSQMVRSYLRDDDYA
ncbi:MAG: 2-amino-4-ketopentanoate thiolase [Bacilli bacterium]|nr:2-amino-4-ketopentanoate thiolase [Bacilli bacterium]